MSEHCAKHKTFTWHCSACQQAYWDSLDDREKLQYIREMECGRGTYSCVGDACCIDADELDRSIRWLIEKVEEGLDG